METTAIIKELYSFLGSILLKKLIFKREKLGLSNNVSSFGLLKLNSMRIKK